MNYHRISIWALLALGACITISSSTISRADQTEAAEEPRVRLDVPRRKSNKAFVGSGDEERRQNEINSDRILVAEPYKSLIQLTTRQVLTQTNISKHVDLDVAMTVLNEASFMLSKPATLIRAVEVVLVVAATSVGATFFIPGAQKQLEAVWRDPGHTMRYLTSGLNERSLHHLLESSFEGLLGRIGLKDEACRFQTLCFVGEKFHSKLPKIPQVVTNFINNHKIGNSFHKNKYIQAFLAGYEDLDCAEINARATDKQCLVNLMEQGINLINFKRPMVKFNART